MGSGVEAGDASSPIAAGLVFVDLAPQNKAPSTPN